MNCLALLSSVTQRDIDCTPHIIIVLINISSLFIYDYCFFSLCLNGQSKHAPSAVFNFNISMPYRCQMQLCPPCNTVRSGHFCICNRVRGYGFARGRTQLHMQMCPGGHNCIMQQRPGGHDCICKTVRPEDIIAYAIMSSDAIMSSGYCIEDIILHATPAMN